MGNPRLTVLVVGASGSIGRLVVEEAVRKGHADGALRKSFELVATQGSAQPDLDAEFTRLDADAPGALDAVHDVPNMPVEAEPQRVRHDLETVSRRS